MSLTLPNCNELCVYQFVARGNPEQDRDMESYTGIWIAIFCVSYLCTIYNTFLFESFFNHGINKVIVLSVIVYSYPVNKANIKSFSYSEIISVRKSEVSVW